MFNILFLLLIFQRISELFIAKRNEKWLLKRGGVEHGSEHYPYIVALHILFLLSLFLEVTSFHKELTNLWYLLFPILTLTQLLRYWSVCSLGYFWNTKIIIAPDEKVVSKGPYQYLKHPNYVVVAIEIFLIPLLFQAYLTALLFTILNFVMMTVRIPIEEKALRTHTNYQKAFQGRSRFTSKR
jgi:methyltransferase